jgi:hypothetical protein
MKTDTAIRNDGMDVLLKNSGSVETERFIMLIRKEPFDYTKGQENFVAGKDCFSANSKCRSEAYRIL